MCLTVSGQLIWKQDFSVFNLYETDGRLTSSPALLSTFEQNTQIDAAT